MFERGNPLREEEIRAEEVDCIDHVTAKVYTMMVKRKSQKRVETLETQVQVQDASFSFKGTLWD